LKTVISELGSYKRRVEIEVPYAEVEPHLEKAFRSYQKKIHLDGFRKGKVPLSLIQKKFGEAIQAEVADDLIQTFFKKAVLEQNLAIVSPGSVQDMFFEKNKPFSFVIEVEVEPAIHITDYKGLKVEKEIVKVTKEDVERMVEAIREQKAQQKPVENGAQNGHIVKGTVQAVDASGVPIIGKKWENWAVELGRPPIGDQITDQLAGVKAGEERRFEIIQPEQTSKGKMQNPADYYSIQVTSVHEKLLPNWDDEFARANGDFKSIAEMEKDIQERLSRRRDEEAERKLHDRLAEEIIHRNDFEVPPSMVENALDRLWEEYQKQPGEHVEQEQYKEENRPSVIRRIKWHLIQKAIIEKEDIRVHEEEVENEIDRIAKASPEEEKKIRSWFKDAQRHERLQDGILEEKVMNFLKEHAKIKESHWKPPKKSIITV
jgi:trigger factor